MNASIWKKFKGNSIPGDVSFDSNNCAGRTVPLTCSSASDKFFGNKHREVQDHAVLMLYSGMGAVWTEQTEFLRK